MSYDDLSFEEAFTITLLAQAWHTAHLEGDRAEKWLHAKSMQSYLVDLGLARQ